MAQNKYNIRYDPQKHDDKWFVLEWWLNKPEMPYRLYKTWPQLYSVFSHIRDVAYYVKYTNAEKYQKTLVLSTPGDGVFETFEAELKEAMERFSLDYRDKNGNLALKLFTHDLGETGAVFLVQIGDPSEDRWGVYVVFYSSHSTGFEGSLKEAFEYIRKNHYYDY